MINTLHGGPLRLAVVDGEGIGPSVIAAVLDVLDAAIANPVLFKALALLFVNVAERVADRHGADYSIASFEEVLIPFFRRLKKSDLPRAGLGAKALHEYYAKALSAGFLIKQWLFA